MGVSIYGRGFVFPARETEEESLRSTRVDALVTLFPT